MNYRSRDRAGTRRKIQARPFPVVRKGFRCFRPQKASPGFTLIEIMVAVALFAMLVSILFGSFSFLLSRVAFVGEGIPVYEQARICFDRLATDLRSIHVALPPAYKPPDFGSDPDPYRVEALSRFDRERQLRFVAFSHLPLGGGLPVREGTIVYYLDESGEQGLSLRRRDTVSLMAGDNDGRFRYFEPDGNDPVVFEQIRSLDFVFFDAQGNSYDYWDSESGAFKYATPRAIQVILVAESGERRHRFETMVDLPVYREPAEGVF